MRFQIAWTCVFLVFSPAFACNYLLDNDEPKLLTPSSASGVGGGSASSASGGAGGDVGISSSSGAAGSCDVSGDSVWSHWKPTEPKTYTIKTDTVVDPATQLEWQRAVSPQTLSWDEAIAYCESLKLDGSKPWRLPTRIELSSIIEYGNSQPAIDSSAFPATASDAFWSSSSYAPSAGDKRWSVYFGDGYVYPNLKGKTCHVRCVRD